MCAGRGATPHPFVVEAVTCGFVVVAGCGWFLVRVLAGCVLGMAVLRAGVFRFCVRFGLWVFGVFPGVAWFWGVCAGQGTFLLLFCTLYIACTDAYRGRVPCLGRVTFLVSLREQPGPAARRVAAPLPTT